MSTTHPTDVLSEWDELQIKYGNYPEKSKKRTVEELSLEAIEIAENQDVLATKTLKQLNKLEDSLDESVLNHYREKRLNELKKIREKEKFGEVYHITRDDYIVEITEASDNNQFVILHLYSDTKASCVLLNHSFNDLAKKYRYIKFCKAVGTSIVEKIPDHHLPTVIVYWNRQCLKQYLGASVWNKDEKRIRTEHVEWVLWKSGFLPPIKDKNDPRDQNSEKVSRVHRIEESSNFSEKSSSSSENEDDTFNKNQKTYSSLILSRSMKYK